MRRAAWACLAASLILADGSLAAEPDDREVVQAIAREIAKLTQEYPQLREFSASSHVDLDGLRIEYAFHTHEPARTGGWTSGVPQPDDDGIWFLIDLHSPESATQLHTQPVVSTVLRIGDKLAYLLIQEGGRRRGA